MTPLHKLIKTTTFRLSIIFLICFGLSAGLAIGYIYWNAKIFFVQQLNQTVDAELQGLDEQYRLGGIALLVQTVRERSRVSGNSLYLVTNIEGKHLAGNLDTISRRLWNRVGYVRFSYTRPAQGGIEERKAFAKVFHLRGGYRLLVGRDIEDRWLFDKIIRDTLWGLVFITLIGITGAWFVSRNILSRIDVVTATSRRIMKGNLSERIPLNGSGDELDRLSTNLNEMLERIEKLMAGLREVSDNIAHDLKTPLNRMRNRVDSALRDGKASPEHKETLQSVIEDADNLIKTFNALLSIARLEAGTGSNRMEQLDLSDIIRDIIELYEPVLEEQGIRLESCTDVKITLPIDKQLIGQAVANLIDNAIKYAGSVSKEERYNKISVSVRSNTQFAEITVADFGPGIAKKDRERVLERFVRLEKSRSLPGSGLGLSLVTAVARLHNGDLILEDNNPGLRAIIRLPLDT